MEDYCFVLMPFKKELDDVYNDCIKPAVEGLALKCIRADEVDATGNIVKILVEHIARAKLIIADLTHKSANVFYELGIANSLGNNTIIIAQNIDEVPFDVKSYQVIIYADTIKGGNILKGNIESRIRNFDNWTKKNNNPVQDFLPEKLLRYTDYKGMFQEIDDYKIQLNKMQDEIDEKAKETEVYRQLLTQLIGENKSASHSTEIIDKAKNLVKRVQEEGEVSVPVPSDNNNEKSKRIKFTKIN